MAMYTDPSRIRATDPGQVKGNPVFAYHDAFNPDMDEVADLKARYVHGRVGDVEVKQRLVAALNSLLAPIQQRRRDLLAENPSVVEDVAAIRERSKRASRLATPFARSAQRCSSTRLIRLWRLNSSVLSELDAEIVVCRLCPRLVAWRERVAIEKVARFAGETYWGRPLPGFGDTDARVFILGLAPAAHGGNRTGRIFTGDRSGDFLCAALHATGFANQPTSTGTDDGLALTDAYVAAAVRCAPPSNRPTIDERNNCAPYLVRELALLRRVTVIVTLGAFAWDAALRAIAIGDATPMPRPRPQFGHGTEAVVGPYRLIGSFHPSQRNTFTGRLTPSMLEGVLRHAGELAAADRPPLALPRDHGRGREGCEKYDFARRSCSYVQKRG